MEVRPLRTFDTLPEEYNDGWGTLAEARNCFFQVGDLIACETSYGPRKALVVQLSREFNANGSASGYRATGSASTARTARSGTPGAGRSLDTFAGHTRAWQRLRRNRPMIDAPMNTAVTAFRNGLGLERVGYFNRAEVESYRAVYIKTFDGRVSDAMRRAAEGNFALMFAIEDGDMDRMSLEAWRERSAVETDTPTDNLPGAVSAGEY
jgi:hypothetical protein